MTEARRYVCVARTNWLQDGEVWVEAIEFVHDFDDLGTGQGGYNEDHEFYGYRMPI